MLAKYFGSVQNGPFSKQSNAKKKLATANCKVYMKGEASSLKAELLLLSKQKYLIANEVTFPVMNWNLGLSGQTDDQTLLNESFLFSSCALLKIIFALLSCNSLLLPSEKGQSLGSGLPFVRWVTTDKNQCNILYCRLSHQRNFKVRIA